jgi:hypothetical protein
MLVVRVRRTATASTPGNRTPEPEFPKPPRPEQRRRSWRRIHVEEAHARTLAMVADVGAQPGRPTERRDAAVETLRRLTGHAG